MPPIQTPRYEYRVQFTRRGWVWAQGRIYQSPYLAARLLARLREPTCDAHGRPLPNIVVLGVQRREVGGWEPISTHRVLADVHQARLKSKKHKPVLRWPIGLNDVDQPDPAA